MKICAALVLLFIGVLPVLAADVIPEGFVMQVLEPTGGKILRPKDWFYTQGGNKYSYVWTLSKEDLHNGHYDTGVKIQCLVGIQEHTHQSPRDFILAFIEKKKKTVKVVKECPEKIDANGLFTRRCLETVEMESAGGAPKIYHVLYSLFWGNDLDMAVVVISGTTPELWDQYSPIFDRMREFELIDMKRFEKKCARTTRHWWLEIV